MRAFVLIDQTVLLNSAEEVKPLTIFMVIIFLFKKYYVSHCRGALYQLIFVQRKYVLFH